MEKGLRTFSGKKPFEIEEMCDECEMYGSELCPGKLSKTLKKNLLFLVKDNLKNNWIKTEVDF